MENTNKIPTNEELVDSLISDFEATCDIKPNRESTSGTPSKEKTCIDSDSPEQFPPDIDSEDCAKEPAPKPDDFIDEEGLKARDETLTEEELLTLKNEADDLKVKGNEQFKKKEFKESADTYTLALRTCPLSFPKERAILFANRAAAKVKLEASESAIEDCSKAIELEPNYLKALLRRAQLYEATDKLDEALADFKKILELDPSHGESMAACHRLPIQINERNEKLKTEMMGKLKDLGNMILRPFGLSTNNFQMVQDPNTGGYSINFKQN